MGLDDLNWRQRNILWSAHKQGGVAIFDGTRRTVIEKLQAAGLVTFTVNMRDIPRGRKVRRFDVTVRTTPAGDALCAHS